MTGPCPKHTAAILMKLSMTESEDEHKMIIVMDNAQNKIIHQESTLAYGSKDLNQLKRKCFLAVGF